MIGIMVSLGLSLTRAMTKATLKVAAVQIGHPVTPRMVDRSTFGWLRGLRRYLGVAALGNVLWRQRSCPSTPSGLRGTAAREGDRGPALYRWRSAHKLSHWRLRSLSLVVRGWPGPGLSGRGHLTIAFGPRLHDFRDIAESPSVKAGHIQIDAGNPGLVSDSRQRCSGLIPIASLWFARRTSTCEIIVGRIEGRPVSCHEKHILPRLLDLSMRHRALTPYRRRQLPRLVGPCSRLALDPVLTFHFMKSMSTASTALIRRHK